MRLKAQLDRVSLLWAVFLHLQFSDYAGHGSDALLNLGDDFIARTAFIPR